MWLLPAVSAFQIVGKVYKGTHNAVSMQTLLKHLLIAFLPLLASALIMGAIYLVVTAPKVVDTTGLQEMGSVATTDIAEPESGGLQEPPAESGLEESAAESDLQEPPAESAPEEPAAR